MQIVQTGDRTTAVLTLHGELDFLSSPALQEVLRESCRPGRDVWLDLRGVTFVDCAALGLITSVRARQQGNGYQLTLHNASPFIVRVLRAVAVQT